MENIKLCPQCKLNLSFDKFQLRPNGKPQSWCKACHHRIRMTKNWSKTYASQQKYRETHRDIINLQAVDRKRKDPTKRTRAYKASLDWLHSHPESMSVYNARYWGRKRCAEGSISTEEWLGCLERFNHVCVRCGRKELRLTMDHIVPLSKGGSNYIDNIQPLCKPCNSFKKDKTIDYRGIE